MLAIQRGSAQGFALLVNRDYCVPALLPPEALELLAHGFHRYYCCELYCTNCGFYRWARLLDGDTAPCPGCGTERPITRLGIIYSRRAESFWESAWLGKTRWPAADEAIPPFTLSQQTVAT